MTMNDQENGTVRDTAPLDPFPASGGTKRRHGCRVCMLVCLVMLLVIILLVVILAFTLFKVKQPKIQVTSTSVEGVAPKFSFPVMNIQLNITLNLTILVHNPNRVSFRAGQGEAQMLYMGEQVGNAVVDPGSIPSKGSATLVCLLTLQAEKFADNGLLSLVKDIMDGELALEVKTRIPGRAKILFIKKHVVTTSVCQTVIGFPDLKIISQDCKQHTKL